jgi:hypothetical protein
MKAAHLKADDLIATKLDPLSITYKTFDPSTGQLRRSAIWQARKRRLVAQIRTWRPSIRITVRLFPRTQRRLDVMELEMKRVKWRCKDLERRLEQVVSE